ncbi:MAG: ABC transporter ATP-binding protein [Alphaproteobacteria bacterium]|nr:ABC transporter ATP-binding protein [Alphaproteobacteria bacterium]
MLSVTGLHKSFATGAGRIKVIDDVSFQIADGTCYALLGPSGCGKTTTLRCVAGLEEPDAGRIEIAGTVVFDSSAGISAPTHMRPIGIVFQSYAIWPHMNVFENVAYPLRVARPRIAGSEIQERVMRVLALVGMEELAQRPAPRLSGGQQQRVAVARALVREPALLLLDEPLSNLDALLRDHMRKELADIIGRIGVTALFVTHDQAEALTLAQRVAVMNAGHIIQEGAPRDIYARPNSKFVAEFLGASNILDGYIAGHSNTLRMVDVGGGQKILARSDLPEGSKIQYLLRPERTKIFLSNPGVEGILQAQVVSATFTGSHLDCAVMIGEAKARVSAPTDMALEKGSPVWIQPLDIDGVILKADQD